MNCFPNLEQSWQFYTKSQLKEYFFRLHVVCACAGAVTLLYGKENVNKTNERKPQNTHTQGGHPKERLKSLFTVRPTADHYSLWVLLVGKHNQSQQPWWQLPQRSHLISLVRETAADTSKKADKSPHNTAVVLRWSNLI